MFHRSVSIDSNIRPRSKTFSGKRFGLRILMKISFKSNLSAYIFETSKDHFLVFCVTICLNMLYYQQNNLLILILKKKKIPKDFRCSLNDVNELKSIHLYKFIAMTMPMTRTAQVSLFLYPGLIKMTSATYLLLLLYPGFNPNDKYSFILIQCYYNYGCYSNVTCGDGNLGGAHGHVSAARHPCRSNYVFFHSFTEFKSNYLQWQQWQ